MNKFRTGGIICELLVYKKPSIAISAMEGKSILLDRGGREDYGFCSPPSSPPAAAAAVHLTSASMVPDFSPVEELT